MRVRGHDAPTMRINPIDELPIRILAEPVATGVRVLVVGASDVGYDATFSLEVSSGGNHSFHHGSATLSGGDRTVLSSATFCFAEGRTWNARLLVEPRGGLPYQLLLSSSS